MTSRTDLTLSEVVGQYDHRAGMEADLKSDKRGLGLGVIRKRRRLAQTMVVRLMQLAHNTLIGARQWLVQQAPRLQGYGLVRLIQEVWAIPGRLKFRDQAVLRVRLRREHPRAQDLCRAFRALLANTQTVVLLS